MEAGPGVSEQNLLGLVDGPERTRVARHCPAPESLSPRNPPAGRAGEPEDIAQACLFLADPSRSGFITGQHFVVDGGLSAAMTFPD